MIQIIFNKKLYEFYFVFILLAVLAPKFSAVDNASLRWFLVSLVNTCFLIYTLFNKNKLYLNSSNGIKTFFVLVIISAISMIQSINLNESIISLNKQLIILSTIFCVSLFVNEKKAIQSLSFLFFISILFESTYVIYEYLINENKNFTGVSMNRNISSFSILVKLPFLFIYQSLNQKQNKLEGIFLETIIIISIILLESRAAILILTTIYLLKSIFLKDKIKSIFNLCLTILIVFIYYPFSRVLQGKDIISSNIMIDESLSLRFDFFSNAIKFFLDSPLIGNGIGMWKIISNQMQLSQVPYYVHNDFLQFLVETGVLGFVFYVLFFLSIFFLIKNKWNNYSIYILLAFLIFLIDSLINFPFHRPQQIITFIIIIGPILSLIDLNKIEFKKSHLIFFIIPLILSNYLSFKDVKASFLENRLRVDLIKNEYTIDKTELEHIDYKLPNLASNTVPFSSYIARYYLNISDYANADELIDIGIKYNPHLSYTTDLKLQSLIQQNKLLQALKVAKHQVDKTNQYKLYFDIIFSISLQLNIESEFIGLYDKILVYKDDRLIVEYFMNYKKIKGLDQTTFNKLLIQSIAKFPNNQDLLKIVNQKVD